MDANEKKKIILVDDNIANLTLGKKVLKDQYEVFTVPSAEKLFQLLGVITPDLILLDIEMPGVNGYAALRKLKEDNADFDIPVIFITSLTDSDSEFEGLSLGAADYIAKPFSPPLLIKRIENTIKLADQKIELKKFNEHLQEMVEKKTEQVLELQSAIMSTLAEMVEFRDNITGDHVGRTVKYLKVLINGMKGKGVYREEMDSWDLNFLLPSAQLHDIGKIAISDLILNKPGKLTDEEFAIMKKHPSIGVEVIHRIEEQTTEDDFLENAKIFAQTHHEKWDGSGYPDGLKGEDIPLLGRLMAVADVYDALISKRPYKEPMSPEKAKMIIEEGSGTHFDPKLVAVFLEVSDDFAKIAENQ
ncbi:MAG: response regulator [Clostridiales Family XIII bacterium]|jgi:putative two-component system response regulator|nr:response regulator [Clostridiales Family XIII bacterium]